MRLFQAQVHFDDFEVPPPYSLERESTRSMPIYLNQYRDGRQRLPTPDKMAIMELSGSFERRRLGKHQQILTDISQRCREQEVSDLSTALSAKVHLLANDPKGREVTFYTTTFMGKPRNQVYQDVVGEGTPRGGATVEGPAQPPGSPRPMFERSYKHFPARKIIRQQTKFDFIKSPSLPKLTVHIPKSSGFAESLKKSKLIERQRINGPIQLDHYISPKADQLAPLVIPSLRLDHDLKEHDKIDTYFSTSRLNLGQRSKTNMTNSSEKNGPLSSRTVKQSLKLYPEQSFTHLHMDTGGHSPPPNSEVPGAIEVA